MAGRRPPGSLLWGGQILRWHPLRGVPTFGGESLCGDRDGYRLVNRELDWWLDWSLRLSDNRGRYDCRLPLLDAERVTL